MSEYHYRYTPPGGGPNRGRNSNGGGEGLVGLLLDILFAVLSALPMVVARVARVIAGMFSDSGQSAGGADHRRSVGGASPGGRAANAPAGQPQPQQASNLHRVQRPVSSPSAPKPGKEPKAGADKRPVKATAGRGLIALGSILTGVFGLGFAVCLAEAGGLAELIACGVFSGIGLLSLFLGVRRRKRAKLYLKYLGLIGRRESVRISTLASAAGRSRKKVCRELQDMLDRGILPVGYLDIAGDRLVLSAQGIEDRPQETVDPAKEDTDDNDILRQIKDINDAIPDPVMSAKIDRIGEITGKILDYQRKNPGKASQLRSFLNYYLPTTLKILQAYAQLDQQGVEGENISAAKTRIEGMMDKVVEGFEKQLDRLFQNEALDITSDVAVLEQMLDKDGLGSGGGMTFNL